MIYTLIMAGGVGSRFWPKSREKCPKQFLDIMGTGRSFLQMTFERSCAFSQPENILVLTNKTYVPLVKSQLPDLISENILAEPSRNNTAPCIAYAAFKLFQKDKEAVMVVLPSDHLILKEKVFEEKIGIAVNFLKNQDALITLGIQPTRADTGYGYIHFEKSDEEVKRVRTFKEKPDAVAAQAYVDSKEYLWNAGIFIWKAKDIIAAFKKNAPLLYTLFHKGMPKYNTDEEADFVEKYYPESPKISIDYAIMEKADNVFTIPADIGWSDVGTWASLWSVLEKDEKDNVLLSEGDSIITNSSGCIISSKKEATVIIDGLNDYIVVNENDALLIYPIKKEQEIKEIIKNLDARIL